MRRNRTASWIGVALFCTVALAAGLDQETAARGLKEALEVAAARSVEFLGRVDGFLENPEVRIEPPEKMEGVAKALRRIGLDRMVDDFELGMNRAAEAAAPLAMDVFRASTTSVRANKSPTRWRLGVSSTRMASGGNWNSITRSRFCRINLMAAAAWASLNGFF